MSSKRTAMKKLIFLNQVLIFYFVLLRTTFSIPHHYTAEDGEEYIIETDLKVNSQLKKKFKNYYLMKNFLIVQLVSGLA